MSEIITDLAKPSVLFFSVFLALIMNVIAVYFTRGLDSFARKMFRQLRLKSETKQGAFNQLVEAARADSAVAERLWRVELRWSLAAVAIALIGLTVLVAGTAANLNVFGSQFPYTLIGGVLAMFCGVLLEIQALALLNRAVRVREVLLEATPDPSVKTLIDRL